MDQQSLQVIEQEHFLINEDATLRMGKKLAANLSAGMTVFLNGPLGAGKTTLCRGILQSYGYTGTVKSPTYTLVETYPDLTIPVCHFDLYRLGDPEELEYIGIRDYFSGVNLCLVEWAERAENYLPQPDFIVMLTPANKNGQYGRKMAIKPAR